MSNIEITEEAFKNELIRAFGAGWEDAVRDKGDEDKVEYAEQVIKTIKLRNKT